MSERTSIEWTDATWNPVRGCTRVSEGCRHCYAERQAIRHAGTGRAYEGLAKSTPAGPRWTGVVRLVPEVLDWPLRRHGVLEHIAETQARPARIFVNSMSDLFHEGLADKEIDQIFAVMALAPQHTFQVLTKRPQRMLHYLTTSFDDEGRSARIRIGLDALGLCLDAMATDRRSTLGAGVKLRAADVGHSGALAIWPLTNVQLIVSVEDQPAADERIPLLLRCPAAVRGVSYEPALGPVDFTRLCRDTRNVLGLSSLSGDLETDSLSRNRLDWVIVGGESGPGARPFDLAWARSTTAQCRGAGVPCFVKQLGSRPWEPTPNHRFDPPDRSVACGCGDCDGTGVRPVFLRDRKGGDWSEWPEDLRIREFPAA